jgi:redox-sensing transcriptional repressor
MDKKRRIPIPTVQRLAAYLTCLREMHQAGVATASSEDLGRRAGSNAAQVRKDLSHVAHFGRPGIGYNVEALHDHIADTLGMSQGHKVLLVGVGSLGRALSLYQGFTNAGFDIAALFDNDPNKIGTQVNGLHIHPLQELKTRNADLRASIGIITVPAPSAQAVAYALVDAGVTCILNFAPLRLQVPNHVTVRAVDLTHELAVLSYFLSTRA